MADLSSIKLDEVWENAVREYQKIAHKDLKDPTLKDIRSVKALQYALDVKCKEFDNFLKRRERLFRILWNVMLPVETIAKIAEAGASMTCPPSQLIFGAVSHLIGAAKNASDAYDAIQIFMSELQDFAARLQFYVCENMSAEHKHKVTEILTTLLKILALSRRVIKQGRVLGFLKKVAIGEDREVAETIAKLDSLTKNENLLLSAETHARVKGLSRTADGINWNVSAMERLMLGQRERERQEDEVKSKDKVREILRPSVGPEDHLDTITKQRISGTGGWILQEPLFKSWTSGAIPLLWISGFPGAGKSFLASNIISFLQEENSGKAQDVVQQSVAYCFFKDNDPKTRSYHQALRDLAYQLVQNDPDYAKYIRANCPDSGAIETLKSAWRELFVKFYINPTKIRRNVYLVLDGLDEAEIKGRSEFLGLLKDLRRKRERDFRLQVILVGQPHLTHEIAVALECGESELPNIDVDSTKNSGDINKYIKTKLQKSRLSRVPGKDFRTHVEHVLSEKAEGMFLWVYLMIQELSTKTSKSAIEGTLRNAPRGLDQMLQHVLENHSKSLDENDADDLNELLAWVTCAKRPLRLGELGAILKYKSPTGDERFCLELDLRKKFASFFVLKREDGRSTSDLQNERYISNFAAASGTVIADEIVEDEDFERDFDSHPFSTEVTFRHASIGDFFRNKNQGKVRAGTNPPVGVNINAARINTLQTLLQIFANEEFKKKSEGSISLLSYGRNSWLQHLEDVEISEMNDEEKKALGSLLVRVCRDEKALSTWTVVIDRTFWAGNRVTLLRRWLDSEEILKFLRDDDREWVMSTSHKPLETFSTFVNQITRAWLEEEHGANPLSYFRIVHSYYQHLNDLRLNKTSVNTENSQIIEEVAESAGYEKTALWHRRVGVALREGEYYVAAKSHFALALELNPNYWQAMSGMARIHHGLGEYEQELRWTQQSVQLMKRELQQTRSPSRDYIGWLGYSLKCAGDCFNNLGQGDKAFEAYREAWNTFLCHGFPYIAIDECIIYFSEKRCYRGIMDILKTLQKKPYPEEGLHHLASYMGSKHTQHSHMFFRFSRHAARETGNLQYLVDVVQEAISLYAKKRCSIIVIILELFLADIYYFDLFCEKDAVSIWERMVSQISAGTAAPRPLAVARQSSMYMLARHYFKYARRTNGTSDCEHSVSRLQDLCKLQSLSKQTLWDDTATMMLGQWYHLNDQNDEAGTCFKDHIRQAALILSDDDPENDQEAILTLCRIFWCLEEEELAVGMWRTYCAKRFERPPKTEAVSELKADHNTNDDEDTSQQESGKPASERQQQEGIPAEDGSQSQPRELSVSDTAKKLDSDVQLDSGDRVPMYCDGVCSQRSGHGFTRTETCSLCRYCFDLFFCDSCLSLIREDKLPINLCSPQHEWFSFQPKAPELPLGKVFVGRSDEMMDLQDFTNGLRKHWDL
ncbi:MAG: hypothetical protein M1822_009849 [Bathelium mastoideum]|nr:MAG: hypothetical protein M1822_009849 [Bathelium mastoideum]